MLSVTSIPHVEHPALFLLGALAVVLFLWRRHASRLSISYIPGPKASWLYGNIKDFVYQQNVGDLDFQFMKEYGRVWRMRSPLGTDILTIADPKALQHCFHKADELYGKRVESTEISRMMMGKGIVWASGPDHERQRKIISPAFTTAQIRSFLPFFRAGAARLTQKWRDELVPGAFSEGTPVPINKWFSRATLDILGETAFDYNFGAVDDKENEVSKAFHEMFLDSRMRPPKWDLLFKRTWYFLPKSLYPLIQHVPTREFMRFHRCKVVVDRVSQRLINEKREAVLAESQSSRDIFSVLVRANVSTNPKSRLSDEELVSQMATLVLAGHVTTSTTLTWLLYELASHQDFQTKMREEIAAARSRLQERGEVDFSIEDLEGMPLTTSCLKETLRYHTPVYHLFRQAEADDVIPLEQPIRTTSGKYVTEIPIAAGQQVLYSICAYQRLPEIWGEDADLWNPMRFLDGNLDKQSKVGLYSNLMSFGAGTRGCLGWRFTIVETLAIIVELVENFKFEPTEDTAKVLRVPTGIMSAWTAGKEREGPQMWLKVVPIL
ncbi:cytochrome P450 [Phanerochaete sordida]|uniref:Cytochrome P450 n=1 Tax=Phanerochaete sordida TaxID=48140 RepID=A0A9P3GCF4_9APHY|nr:cytochrome P450 [Phanerochaete sordida]